MSIVRVLLLCAALLQGWNVQAREPLNKISLTIGMYRIEAELADDEPARLQGLMHRRAMAPQAGMLFVFDKAQSLCMWMRNTYLPLSVAFLDASGSVINIEDMLPLTEDSHCANAPALYALEMNKGWFAAKNIGPGAKVQGIPGLK